MDFKEKYILENEQVLLRPLELSDFDNLKHFAINEPELWKYSLIQAIGESGLQNYMNLAIQDRDAETEYPFIVVDKRRNEYAGSTRFYDINIQAKYATIGCTWYGKKFQGTGLNKHCKYLLLAFAFETLQLERVEFRADNENKRSIQAMKSIGCTVEGVLRSNGLKADGKRRDSIVLSILKDEWFGRVKENLISKMC